MQWLLLWLVTLTDVSSLNRCGMLHAKLHLEATKWFPCIALLQIYKASHYLCAGGSGLPFHSLDSELKQKFSFPSLFRSSVEAFPLTQVTDIPCLLERSYYATVALPLSKKKKLKPKLLLYSIK